MVNIETPIIQILRQNKFINNGNIKIRKASVMFTGKTLEYEYQRRLRGLIIRNMKEQINFVLLPQIQSIIDEANILRPVRMDDYSDMIVDSMNKLRIGFGRTVTDLEIMMLAKQTGELTSNFQRKQVTRVLASQIGIDVFISEPWLQGEMAAFVENNVSLIKTISSETFDEIEGITFRGARQGLSRDKIVTQIKGKVDIATYKANRIARDQVNKFFGQLNKLRQTSIGVKEYFWRTVGDNRVRPSHAAKDARTYSWKKPPADTGHPGEDIQCRCYAEPKLILILKELEAA